MVRLGRSKSDIAVELTAVVIAVTDEEPRVLVVRRDGQVRVMRRRPTGMPDRNDGFNGLPSGPLEPNHRTLESGLRAWVETQTRARLGYVEQLYTFGDRNREAFTGADRSHMLSIGYLALTREAPLPRIGSGAWQNWYRYFPWEDWRAGRPGIIAQIERPLLRWATSAADKLERRARKERLSIAFGLGGIGWSEERVLDRYELLYEAGLVPEAHCDQAPVWAKPTEVIAEAEAMVSDHRRILATAIARLRGKIKYRPVVFELMPPTFTLLQLQRAVEALAGMRLHKQNFRRLIAQQGLVEETGNIVTGTGGRPAREVQFRREATLERPAPGMRLPIIKPSR